MRQRHWHRRLWAMQLSPLLAGPTMAEVIRFEVQKTAPAYEGRNFGTVGAYEVVKAEAVIAVDPADPRNAGNGLMMEQGYTLVWSGWQFDAPRTLGQLALDVPRLEGVTGISRERIVFDKATGPLRSKLTYPAAEA